MDRFDKGKLIWWDPGVGYYVPGEVADVNVTHKILYIQSDFTGKNHLYETRCLNKVMSRTEMPIDGVEDMICLSDLSEGSLLWNLKVRYEHNKIYTYTGSILISVNPYKMFDIYNLEMVKKYESHPFGSLPPHLFAIGSAAFAKMMKDHDDQVIVISGESGAGKTESTKLLMQYLAAANKAPIGNTITQQILEANPLLESFGNAKTIRNDNSSRFGKYLEVYFRDGVIAGAQVSEYLLEKSRIVSQSNEERNYHVFYELLSGFNEEQKQKYGLLDADKYFYLNQGGNCIIEHKDDGEDFKALIAGFDILGFTKQEQDNIFKILSSVLHIGNVYFIRKQDKNFHDTVDIDSESEIKWVSYLLGINEHVLIQKLTYKITEARHEKVLTPFNIDQALDARDAIAKALYSRLFQWLVERINSIICKTLDKKISIAILDIFGFENFNTNGFEQFCINYANETLQFYFNKHIFKIEQEEYAKEKITWKNIEYNDNKPCIDLISKKPNGIIHILDDESSFPKSSDASFLEKLHFTHSFNRLYGKPRMSSPEFSICHYAGEVVYEVRNFLDKNRDLLRSDVIEMLINSKNLQLSRMFRDLRGNFEPQRSMSKSGKYVTMKAKTPTVGAKFHDSLKNLLETMSKCNPFFVRCIKPNNKKAPMNFECKVVLQQLSYTGMLETIKIRKLGYPIRYKFHYFINRYKVLIGRKPVHMLNERDMTNFILSKLDGKYKHQYQIGFTKVFLRESLDQHLEQLRINITQSAAIVIQKYFRKFIAQKRYLDLRMSAIVMQKYIRGWLERHKYKKIRNGFIKLQAQFRMNKQRNMYLFIMDELDRKQQEKPVAKKRSTKSGIQNKVDLNVPSDLEVLLRKADEWTEFNVIKDIQPTSSLVNQFEGIKELPDDLKSFAFNKYVKIYIKDDWYRHGKPIEKTFLSKQSAADVKESLDIFKLVLKCVQNEEYDGRRDKVLVDYILQKVQNNLNLRDEIYIQILNQTWNNEMNEHGKFKSWQLLVSCLSLFAPSQSLYKYLFRYIMDYGDGYLKTQCQKKLLESAEVPRLYPLSLLEWKSSIKCGNMAITAGLSDGSECLMQLNSWTTAESFSREVLRNAKINSSELNGWTVSVLNGDLNGRFEAIGNDYVLDLISSMEKQPSGLCRSSFFRSSLINDTVTSDYIELSNACSSQTVKSCPRTISRSQHGGKKYRANSKTRSKSRRKTETQPKEIKTEERVFETDSEFEDFYQVTHNNSVNDDRERRHMRRRNSNNSDLCNNKIRYLNERFNKSKVMSDVVSEISEQNTIKKIPIPNKNSNVEEFLDNIFDRALDSTLAKRQHKKQLHKRIKGGDGSNKKNSWSSIGGSDDDDNNGDSRMTTRPNQDYEFEKILKTFLKNRSNWSQTKTTDNNNNNNNNMVSFLKKIGCKDLNCSKGVNLKDRIKGGMGKVKDRPADWPFKSDDEVFVQELKSIFEPPKKVTLKSSSSNLSDKSNTRPKEDLSTFLYTVPSLPRTIRGLSQRAKTVRIANVRWPPPLNTNTYDKERQLEIQKEIKKEILAISKNPTPTPTEIVEFKMETTIDLSNDSNANMTMTMRTTITSDEQYDDCQYSALILSDEETSKNEVSVSYKPVTNDDMSTTSLNNIYDRLNPYESVSIYDEPIQINSRDKGRTCNNEVQVKTPSQFYTYTKAKWSLHIRKEVFGVNEKLESEIAINLIFLQIINDLRVCSVRIRDDDKSQILKVLDINNFDQNQDFLKLDTKKRIIQIAKSWPLYFCRLFPVYLDEKPFMLGLSHSGVRLIKYENSLVIIEQYNLWDIKNVSLDACNSIINFVMSRNGKKMSLHSRYATQIKEMFDAYSMELNEHETKYVQAIRDYVTDEETLLSFRKGDIIRLLNKTYTPNGWLRGFVNGRKGVFPQEYVKPISRVELSEVDNGNRMAICDGNSKLSKIIENLNTTNDEMNGESDGFFSMLEFAMMNFKQSIDKCAMIGKKANKLHGSILQKLRDSRLFNPNNGHEWTWSEYAEMVKYTKSPITTSLLKLNRHDQSRIAVNCFIEIMKFMGDYPVGKGQKDTDSIYFLFQALNSDSDLYDEVYCQLIKQTTNNKSTKKDSCFKGWKILSILTTYYKPSDLLKPYLFKYLENNAYDMKRPYNAIALTCLTNLRKTFKYGGRRVVPSIHELNAIISGMTSKRQMFLLPGGVPIILNIKSCTVVDECIDQICGHLGVYNKLEQYEYAVYYIVESEKIARPLNKNEFLFDVLNELMKLNSEFYFIFKRILWFYALRLDTAADTYIDMMYNQVMPDYREGLNVITHMNSLSDEQNNDIAFLTALQYRASNKFGLPNIKEIKYLLPKIILDLNDWTPHEWVQAIHLKLRQIEYLSVTEAKAKFLEKLQDWQLFGSTYFYVKDIHETRFHGDCILGINKHGIQFMHKQTHELLLAFTFNEVISTRRFKDEITKQQYIYLKCGNLMVQKVIRIQTDEGNDIAMLIGQYIDVINKHEEQSQSNFIPSPLIACHQQSPMNCSMNMATTVL